MGVPIIRTIVFWGLYWGPPILGSYHVAVVATVQATVEAAVMVMAMEIVIVVYWVAVKGLKLRYHDGYIW